MQENNVGDFLCISWSLQQSSAIFEALGGVIPLTFFLLCRLHISVKSSQTLLKYFKFDALCLRELIDKSDNTTQK